MPGEVLHGYASRLARAFLTDARSFCCDFGLSFKGLVCGRSEEVGKFADLVGEPTQDLLRRAPIGENGQRILAGQRLSSSVLRLGRLLVCPACLRDDVVASRAPADQAAFVRMTWLVAAIHTCATHRLALQEVSDMGDKARGDWQHDLSTRLGPFLGDLDASVAGAPSRPASGFEEYLAGRIQGAPPSTPLLDSLPFDAAVNLAETFGAVATSGRQVRISEIDGDALREVGAVGYSIVAGGEARVRALMVELRAVNERNADWNTSVYAAYGPIYRLLARKREAHHYGPVRDIVRRHILETTPVAAGTEVLGEVVSVRTIHSFRSATAELNRPGVSLRCTLVEAGLLPEGLASSKTKALTFDAEKAEALLKRFKDGVSLTAAARTLGLHAKTLKILVSAGLVEHRPLPRGAATAWCFEPAVLDGFLRRLLADARDVREPGGDVQDLFKAGKTLGEPVETILSLVLEGRLGWVGRRPDGVGCRALLVDVRQVEALLDAARDPADDLVPARDLRAVLRMRDGSVRRLIASGVMPSEPASRSGRKGLFDCVRRRDLDRFDGEFSTPSRYADDRGLRLAEVLSTLRKAGIDPAFSVDDCGVTVFRREDLDRLFPSLQPASIRDQMPSHPPRPSTG